MKIRIADSGDSVAIKNLVMDCYGTLAANQNFYLPELMAYLIQSSQIRIYLAEEDGKIVSMEACREEKEFPGSLYMEAKMTLGNYRGKGIAKEVLNFMLSDSQDSSVKSFCAYAKGNSKGIQKLLEVHGFHAAGFVFHDFFDGIEEGKNSNIVMVYNKGVRFVGQLYAPAEIQRLLQEVYGRLQTEYQLCSQISNLKGKTEYTVMEDTVHQNLSIILLHGGSDIMERAESWMEKCLKWELQTVQLYLNMKDESAAGVYEHLKKLGFQITGLRPLCGEREYIILYYSKALKIDKNSIILENESRKLMELLFQE